IVGRVLTEQVCPKCKVSGQEFEEACPTCHGKGTENKTVKLEVKVPEGVDNEQQIILAGEGSPGVNGGPAGDLYVVFRVKPSETFKRDGDDKSLKYMKLTGRSDEHIALVKEYLKQNHMFFDVEKEDP
ncbi:DnaJ C-terminal domain-containing protein, partial [Staphylococcus aureus]|uniref:DnaJ C-terminal domain-containing protein n=1 Tax=Staphylococcus aureus TaxID=1280 RepID=UPI00272E818B